MGDFEKRHIDILREKFGNGLSTGEQSSDLNFLQVFHKGYPAGTGRSFVPPEFVILGPHLSSLSRQELKEYIRPRMPHRQNESPEERKNAKTLAVQETKKVASKQTAIQTLRSAPSTPATHTKPPKPTTPNTPKGGILNGVFLGFWSDSDAVQDIDKHAAFGVVDSSRLRVKIIKFTRDAGPTREISLLIQVRTGYHLMMWFGSQHSRNCYV
jgi:hypothetical protein